MTKGVEIKYHDPRFFAVIQNMWKWTRMLQFRTRNTSDNARIAYFGYKLINMVNSVTVNNTEFCSWNYYKKSKIFYNTKLPLRNLFFFSKNSNVKRNTGETSWLVLIGVGFLGGTNFGELTISFGFCFKSSGFYSHLSFRFLITYTRRAKHHGSTRVIKSLANKRMISPFIKGSFLNPNNTFPSVMLKVIRSTDEISFLFGNSHKLTSF